MSNEIWKSVPGYPDIEVSNQARVRIKQSEKLIKPFENMDRYCQVDLHKYNPNGLTKMPTLHKLVCLAVHGEPPKDGKKYVVDHLDMNTLNSRPENLEWVDFAENCKRARANKPKEYFKRWNIFVLELNQTFSSIREASEATGIRLETVRANSTTGRTVNGYTYIRVDKNSEEKNNET